MDNKIVSSVAVALSLAATSAVASIPPPPPPVQEVMQLQVFDLETEVAGADSIEAATSDAEAAGFFVFTGRRAGG